MRCGACHVKHDRKTARACRPLLFECSSARAGNAARVLAHFAGQLHALLTSVAGGSAFNACFVCKREFGAAGAHSASVTLLLLGVANDGAVRVRLAFCCGAQQADGNVHCADLLQRAIYKQKHVSSVGVALSVRPMHGMRAGAADTIVRVHARGREHEQSDSDLLLQFASF